MCPRALMWRRRSAESAGPRGTLFGRRHFSETNDNYPCRSMGDASTMNESHAALTRLPTRLFHQGEGQFVPCVFISIKQRVCFSFHLIHERLSRWIKPSTTSRLLRTFVEGVSTSWFLR